MASRGAWGSFNQGLQSGYTLGEKYQQAKEREELQRIMNETPKDNQSAYDNYNAKLKAEDEATFGSSGIDEVNAGKKGLGYSVAGQKFADKPSDAEVYAAKTNRAADYLTSQGKVEQGMSMRTHGMQYAAAADAADQRKQQKEFDKKWADYFNRAKKDPFSVRDELIPDYNVDSGGYADGHIIAKASKPGGGTILTRINKENGRVVDAREDSPEVAMKMIEQAYMMQRAALGGQFADAWIKYGQGERAAKAAEKKEANETEYRRGVLGVQERDLEEKIRTGNWGQVGANKALEDYRRNPAARGTKPPSEMSVQDRLAMNAAIDERTDLLIRRAGKDPAKIAKSQLGEYDLYREQAAASLGFDSPTRVRGLGQPAAGGGQPGPGAIVNPYEKKVEAGTAVPQQSVVPKVVNMERAGTSFGSDQYVVTYDNGQRELISGDEAKRMYILNTP